MTTFQPVLLQHNITIRQGSDFIEQFQLWDSNNGCPFDISDWTFAAQLRDTHNAVTTSGVFSIAIVSAVSGTFQLLMGSTTTRTLIPSHKVWDLEMSSGSFEFRAVEGLAPVTPEVTR